MAGAAGGPAAVPASHRLQDRRGPAGAGQSEGQWLLVGVTRGGHGGWSGECNSGGDQGGCNAGGVRVSVILGVSRWV